MWVPSYYGTNTTTISGDQPVTGGPGVGTSSSQASGVKRCARGDEEGAMVRAADSYN